MTGTMKNTVLIALIVVVGLYVFYQYDSSLMGLLRRTDGFDNQAMADPNFKTSGPDGGPAAGASKGKAVADVTAGNPNIASKGVTGKAKAVGDELKKLKRLQDATLVTSSRQATFSPRTRNPSMRSRILMALAHSRARTSSARVP